MSVLPTHEVMLRSLVALPSTSSPDPRFDRGNRDVIEAIAGYAEHLGFEVDVRPLATNPAKANLVATLGEGEGGLVFSGHSDTVPFDAGAWTFDPFELHEVEGRLHGLGSADMKGFFPAV